jgi:hypothetical protein
VRGTRYAGRARAAGDAPVGPGTRYAGRASARERVRAPRDAPGMAGDAPGTRYPPGDVPVRGTPRRCPGTRHRCLTSKDYVVWQPLARTTADEVAPIPAVSSVVPRPGRGRLTLSRLGRRRWPSWSARACVHPSARVARTLLSPRPSVPRLAWWSARTRALPAPGRGRLTLSPLARIAWLAWLPRADRLAASRRSRDSHGCRARLAWLPRAARAAASRRSRG